MVRFLYGFKTADDDKFIEPEKMHQESKPFVRSAAIQRYWNTPPSEYIWYVPDVMVRNRKTARPGEKARFESEKIIVARMGKALVGTYDPGGLFVKDAMLLLGGNTKYSLKYILGVINSRLMNYYYKEFFVTIDVLKNALLSLPIFVIDFSNPTDVEKHDRMVALVECMLELHKQLAAARLPQEKEMLERQIHSTDDQIDRLVYDQYGLAEEEIKIVEEKNV